MGIGNFFKSLLGTQPPTPAITSQTGYVNANYYNDIDNDYTPPAVRGEIMQSALDVAIDYIAACIGKSEIQTYNNNKYTKGSDWYRWNVRPNYNQTSTEFWHEFVYRLIKNKEVLVIPVGDQLLIAESFSKTEYALKPTVFTGISRKGLTLNGIYTTETAIYLSTEFSANLNRLINGLGSVLDETLEIACEHYYNDGGEHGVLYLDADASLNDPEQDALEKKYNAQFVKHLKKRNSVMILWNGMKYEKMQSNNSQKSSLVTDITAITKEAYSKVGQALRVPPALLLGEVANLSGTAMDNLINFGVMPILDSFIECANAVMYSKNEYLSGNYVKVDYTAIKYMDALECSAGIDKLRADGIYSANDIRVKFGEDMIDDDSADSYVVTKNYEKVGEQGAGK